MTAVIATLEPSSVAAGDRIQWQKTLADYPAVTWTLKYYFRNAAGKIDITAGASGTDHLVDVPALTSKTWGAGLYSGQGYAFSGSDRFLVWRGPLQVVPNFELAGSYDGRTHERIVLDAIEAVIENRATLDQEEYQIGTRSLKRTPLADLTRLRDKYRALVRGQEGGSTRLVARLT